MSAAKRAELARTQQSLIDAAVGRGPVPATLDARRVEAIAEVLARKRMRAVAKSWPGLAGDLGPMFASLFEQFANVEDAPPPGGSRADGRQFARFVARRLPLPPAARFEIIRFDVRFRVRAGRLVPRWFAVVPFRQRRRLGLVIHCRYLGITSIAVGGSGTRAQRKGLGPNPSCIDDSTMK